MVGQVEAGAVHDVGEAVRRVVADAGGVVGIAVLDVFERQGEVRRDRRAHAEPVFEARQPVGPGIAVAGRGVVRVEAGRTYAGAAVEQRPAVEPPPAEQRKAEIVVLADGEDAAARLAGMVPLRVGQADVALHAEIGAIDVRAPAREQPSACADLAEIRGEAAVRLLPRPVHHRADVIEGAARADIEAGSGFARARLPFRDRRRDRNRCRRGP